MTARFLELSEDLARRGGDFEGFDLLVDLVGHHLQQVHPRR